MRIPTPGFDVEDIDAEYTDGILEVRLPVLEGSTDPLRVRLTISVDGDELALTVDGDLRILDGERRLADRPPGTGGARPGGDGHRE